MYHLKSKVMRKENFGMGFFGRNPFDHEARKKFQEGWSKKTDSEKLDFMNRKVEDMGKDHFSVEAIDARCSEWMKKTPEEKQTFVDEKKKMMEKHRSEHFAGYHHGFSGNEDGFFNGRDFKPQQTSRNVTDIKSAVK